jgi:hypothetical protein
VSKKMKKGKGRKSASSKTATRGISSKTCSAHEYFTGANEAEYKGGKKSK